MRAISDQVLAKRMLEARGESGYRFRTFIRRNAIKYVFMGVYFVLSLALLAILGVWIGFWLVLGMWLGSFLRDLGWVRASRRAWPFTMRVTNWDLVEQLAGLKPPDGVLQPDDALRSGRD